MTRVVTATVLWWFLLASALPAQPQAAGRVVIGPMPPTRGTVTYEGKPAARVTVYLATAGVTLQVGKLRAVSAAQSWQGRFPQVLVPHVLTDEHGDFQQSPSGPHIVVSYGGKQEAPQVAAFAQDPTRGLAGIAFAPQGSHKPLSITLTKGATVTSTVVDQTGKPLADIPVTISALPQQGRREGCVIFSGASDTAGKIKLGPLPTEVTLHLAPAPGVFDRVVTNPWQERPNFVLKPGQELQLPALVVNPQGRSLKVAVTDTNQQIVKGALVFATGLREPLVVGDQPLTEITGLPLHGKVWVVAVDPTKPLFAAQIVDPDWNYLPGLVLQPLGKAAGQVVDKQGKPVAGARVNLQAGLVPRRAGWMVMRQRALRERLAKAGGDHLEATTDATGKWHVSGLIDGMEYGLIVYPKGSKAGRVAGGVVGKCGATADAGTQTIP